MSLECRCDICGRSITAGYNLVATLKYTDAHSGESEMHICGPRDGADVGCSGHFKAGLSHAQERAAVWLSENRPESIRASV